MSVAFRRENDEEHKEPRFELPIPPGPNLVTPRGLALIAARIAELRADVAAATDEDSRTLRRETKAYEATIKLSGGEAPSSRGYDLVLSGRLTGLAGGRVISCIGGEDVSPSCMISARIDHVSLNEPDGGILAQWSSS